jgi:beta-xylosidase
VADDPAGPYEIQPEQIAGSYSIDPAVFVDDDGSAYMVFGGIWGGQLECYGVEGNTYDPGTCQPESGEGASTDGGWKPRIAKMADNMLEFDGSPQAIDIQNNPVVFFEGSWIHKHNDMYYLSWSTGPTHEIHYGTASSPMGPYTYGGRVFPDHGIGWTTHHSIIEFQGKWYLFYHDSSCAVPNNASNSTAQRCVKYAELTYNDESGGINQVQP